MKKYQMLPAEEMQQLLKDAQRVKQGDVEEFMSEPLFSKNEKGEIDIERMKYFEHLAQEYQQKAGTLHGGILYFPLESAIYYMEKRLGKPITNPLAAIQA